MADMIVDGNVSPKGYQQITNLSASVGLTVPSDARLALIIPETQPVRWLEIGTPTASVGMPQAVGQVLWYTGNLKSIRFIEQSASATLNVTYYG